MNKLLAVGSMLALLLGTTQAVRAAEEHDHHATESKTALELDHGKKWKTDAPLRKGMSDIHGRVQKVPRDAAAAAALARAIHGDIDGIVKNCKLTPKADGVLHVILHDVLSGAEKIEQGKSAASREEGVHTVHRALTEYTHYFEHAGWPKAE